MIFGILHADGTIDSIQRGRSLPPQQPADGSYVPVAAMPAQVEQGIPLRYDAQTQTATQSSADLLAAQNDVTAGLTEMQELAQDVQLAITWLQGIQDEADPTIASSLMKQAQTDEAAANIGEGVTITTFPQAQTEIRKLYTGAKRAAQRDQKIATALERLTIISRRMLKLVARRLAGKPVQ